MTHIPAQPDDTHAMPQPAGPHVVLHGNPLALEGGTVVYVSHAADAIHWPAGTNWQASAERNVDLAILRLQLVTALRRVEDELSARGLLARVTPEGTQR